MRPTLQERCKRALASGPAFSDEVAATLDADPRTVSATLNTLWKRGDIIRSNDRVQREGTTSAWLYSLRHKKWRHWTTRDIERLRALEGQHPEVIAAKLGRTVPSVRNQARQLGVKLGVRRKLTVWSPDVRMQAAMLRRQGRTYKQISETLGVPLGTVQAWL